LSEWERLDRAREVAERDLAAADAEVQKLERQIERIDSGEIKVTDRGHFARSLSGAQLKRVNAKRRFEEAQARQAAHEATLARFAPPPPEADGPVLEGEELSSTIAEIKGNLEEERGGRGRLRKRPA
jgi:ATPase subunit of ABC transporter with duplicated ATPase domains